MGIGDYIILAIVAVILIAIIIYIVRQKKKGVKCIGCQVGCKACENAKKGCCGCNTQQQKKN